MAKKNKGFIIRPIVQRYIYLILENTSFYISRPQKSILKNFLATLQYTWNFHISETVKEFKLDILKSTRMSNNFCDSVP